MSELHKIRNYTVSIHPLYNVSEKVLYTISIRMVFHLFIEKYISNRFEIGYTVLDPLSDPLSHLICISQTYQFAIFGATETHFILIC